MEWVRRTKKGRSPGEHSVSGLPTGTEIIHNPTRRERETTIGLPHESEILERHGRHFHLIEGSNRIVIEMAHYVEVRRDGQTELVDERTLYVLSPKTDLWRPAVSVTNCWRCHIHPSPIGVSHESSPHGRAAAHCESCWLEIPD
jgi:hypothetical protein